MSRRRWALAAVGLGLLLLGADVRRNQSITLQTLTLLNGLTVNASGITFGNDNSQDVGTATNRPRDLYVARNAHVGGYTHLGATTFAVHAVTVAADGTTNAAAEILTGVVPVQRIECRDTNGCTIRVSETGWESGAVIRIVNIGANNILMGDHTTVGTRQHLAGALTGTPNATIQFLYLRDPSGSTGWYELGRSVN